MSGEGAPVLDTPPGKDGAQGQHPDTPVPPPPVWEAGANPPGTNPPVPAPVDPATIPPPGTHPIFDGPHEAQPTNQPQAPQDYGL